jgi:hypothetical protein
MMEPSRSNAASKTTIDHYDFRSWARSVSAVCPAYDCSRMSTGIDAGGGVGSCMTPEQLRSVLPFAKFPSISPPLQALD